MILRIIRGLPGSGKSTFSSKFPGFHIEADMFHIRNGEYNWTKEKSGDAHAWCIRQTRNALRQGFDVTVSNTFINKGELRKYFLMAKRYNCKLEIYAMHSSYGSIHNVPQSTLDHMAKNWEDIDGEIVIK